MAKLTRRQQSGSKFQLDRHTIGNALVVSPPQRLTAAAQSLAMSLPADPDNDVVVVDLPIDTPVGVWDSVAKALPRGKRGVRLVLGGRPRETTAMAGQWLSERLGRTVVAPDGDVVRCAAGGLYVHSGPDGGWMRFSPGQPPEWEGKRFPRPMWDAAAVKSWPTSSTAVAEPIPGGVWIHPVTGYVRPHWHWSRFAGQMPCQADRLTVVLGCPGAPSLSVDDVIRFWHSLGDSVRLQVRFVQYGPVRLPDDEANEQGALGQALADAFGEPVTCYPGLPFGSPEAPDMYTVCSDGALGWPTFVAELMYLPSSHPGYSGIPLLIGCRSPIGHVQELAPAVYWYAPDAAVEVVQSGLWVRPHEVPGNASVVRGHIWHPDVHLLVFDSTDETSLPRMRMLAQDVLGRLDPAVRARSRIVAATELGARATVRLAGPSGGELSAVAPNAARPSAPDAVVDLAASGGKPSQALAEVQPTDVLVTGPPLTEQAPARTDEASVAVMSDPGVPALPMLPGSASEAATTVDSSGRSDDFTPIRLRLESEPSTLDQIATKPAADKATESFAQKGQPVIEGQQPERGLAPEPPSAPKPARLQPTPPPEAAALIPSKGLDRERAWLRRTLSREFDTMANSISRILSEHPGFQGSDSRTSSDVLTDTVAVRLYLTASSASVDEALRAARNGPHVPLARCVVSGLSRLPSHRGTAVFAASPSPQQWAFYEQRRLVTEWGFTHALTDPSPDQSGDVDVLVWSMTARRTRLLEPLDDDRVDNRVVFVPGTNFKVLELVPAQDGQRGRLFLRELAPSEVDEIGRVAPDRVSLDELAMNAMHRSVDRWSAAEPAGRIGPAALDRFSVLPGLA